MPRVVVDNFKVLKPDILKKMLETGISAHVQSVL